MIQLCAQPSGSSLGLGEGPAYAFDGLKYVRQRFRVCSEIGHPRPQSIGLPIESAGAGVTAHKAVAKGGEGHARDDCPT